MKQKNNAIPPRRTEKNFTPQMSPSKVATRRPRWTDALNRSKQWAQPAEEQTL